MIDVAVHAGFARPKVCGSISSSHETKFRSLLDMLRADQYNVLASIIF